MKGYVSRLIPGLLLANVLTLSAGTISNLFNTGVKNDGTDATGGSPELHYTSQTASPLNMVFVLGAPNGAWLANTAASQWIGPDTSDGSTIMGGNYSVDYRTMFDLTGFNPATAILTGRWSTDNIGTDIKINGTSTGNTSSGFSNWFNFTISSGFVSGINTLDFLWTNQGGPGGVRVEISGTANPTGSVPEPSSFGLFVAGLIGLGLIGRRRLASLVSGRHQ
jgi:hypothetical protein